jgi:DNA-binding NarL/FixJ family response regulator
MIWLYIIIVGGVCIAIAALLPSEKKKEEQVEEMQAVMDSLSHFVSEMEQDNKELMDMVKQIKREQDQQINKLYDRVDYLERQTHDVSQKLLEATMQTYPVIDVPAETVPNAPRRRKKIVTEDALPEPETVVTVNRTAVHLEQQVSEPDPQQEIKERYQQVFSMYAGGKSIEQIARKLSMNKGEVQLIIQLYHQEGTVR